LAFGIQIKISDSGTCREKATTIVVLNVIKRFEKLKHKHFILLESFFLLNLKLNDFGIKDKGSHLNESCLRQKNLVSSFEK
jgi:hypothetical protein